MRVERGMKRFNEVCRVVASRHHVVVLEGFDHPIATDRSTYAEDGFHPSEEGHRAAAREFLRALRKRLRIRAWVRDHRAFERVERPNVHLHRA